MPYEVKESVAADGAKNWVFSHDWSVNGLRNGRRPGSGPPLLREGGPDPAARPLDARSWPLPLDARSWLDRGHQGLRGAKDGIYLT